MPRDQKDPFDMLLKSHRRLQENLALLRGAEDWETVAEVAEFIARTVVRHEKDEEESLFPRLRDDAELAPLLLKLESQHREHEKLHAELRLLAGGEPDAARLKDLSARLDAAYEAHVDVEENQVFPAAREALDGVALAAMASEMRARRGKG